MTTISDYIYDSALSKFDTEASHIYLCSAEPTTYAAATAANNGTTQFGLGNKTIAAGDIDPPSDRVGGGRKITVEALTGGTVTSTGTATHYALVDASNSRLLATGALSASQALTSGNTFSTAAFDVGIPDPA